MDASGDKKDVGKRHGKFNEQSDDADEELMDYEVDAEHPDNLNEMGIMPEGIEKTPVNSDSENCLSALPKHPQHSKPKQARKAKHFLKPKQLDFADNKEEINDVQNKTHHHISKDVTSKNHRLKSTSRKQSVQDYMHKRDIVRQGTWVQCCENDCRKWRHLTYIDDPALVPEVWVCSMSEDTLHNSCDKPQIDFDESDHRENFVYTKYAEGSIVWARTHGYPWWPAMVEIDPDIDIYVWTMINDPMEPTHYHVVYLDDHVSRAWVTAKSIKLFSSKDEAVLKPVRGISYKSQILAAVHKAVEALELSLEERLKKFSFSTHFTGKWGKLKEECKKNEVLKGKQIKIKNGSYVQRKSQQDANKKLLTLHNSLSDSELDDVVGTAQELLGDVDFLIQSLQRSDDENEFNLSQERQHNKKKMKSKIDKKIVKHASNGEIGTYRNEVQKSNTTVFSNGQNSVLKKKKNREWNYYSMDNGKKFKNHMEKSKKREKGDYPNLTSSTFMNKKKSKIKHKFLEDKHDFTPGEKDTVNNDNLCNSYSKISNINNDDGEECDNLLSDEELNSVIKSIDADIKTTKKLLIENSSECLIASTIDENKTVKKFHDKKRGNDLDEQLNEIISHFRSHLDNKMDSCLLDTVDGTNFVPRGKKSKVMTNGSALDYKMDFSKKTKKKHSSETLFSAIGASCENNSEKSHKKNHTSDDLNESLKSSHKKTKLHKSMSSIMNETFNTVLNVKKLKSKHKIKKKDIVKVADDMGGVTNAGSLCCAEDKQQTLPQGINKIKTEKNSGYNKKMKYTRNPSLTNGTLNYDLITQDPVVVTSKSIRSKIVYPLNQCRKSTESESFKKDNNIEKHRKKSKKFTVPSTSEKIVTENVVCDVINAADNLDASFKNNKSRKDELNSTTKDIGAADRLNGQLTPFTKASVFTIAKDLVKDPDGCKNLEEKPFCDMIKKDDNNLDESCKNGKLRKDEQNDPLENSTAKDLIADVLLSGQPALVTKASVFAVAKDLVKDADAASDSPTASKQSLDTNSESTSESVEVQYEE